MNKHSHYPPEINRLSPVDRADIIARSGDLAQALLGTPSYANRKEMRWGAHQSVSLVLSGPKAGQWFDFSTGEGGDIFHLIQRERGCTFPEAVAWAGGAKAILPVCFRVDRRSSTLAELDRLNRARKLYNEARSAGEEGRAYFEGRGLDWIEPVARQMRLAMTVFSGFDGEHRTLLMPLYSFRQRHLNAVHRIAIDLRDADGRRVKRTTGIQKGTAMMLGHPGRKLAVCEGLETGVAAIMGGLTEGASLWALGSTSIMKTFEPIEGVRELIICADNDVNKAGQQAARICAELWRERAAVTIHTPRKAGTDWADQCRRKTP